MRTSYLNGGEVSKGRAALSLLSLRLPLCSSAPAAFYLGARFFVCSPVKHFLPVPKNVPAISEKLGKGHKACCVTVGCVNTGSNARAIFFSFPSIREGADVELLPPLLGPLQKKGAYADLAETSLLFSAVSTVGVEEQSLIDEDSCQSPVLRAYLLPGPSGLVADGCGEVRLASPEAFRQKRTRRFYTAAVMPKTENIPTYQRQQASSSD
nr:uncharacterized protein LOC129381861 [Dermacentor andersoni]